MQFGAARKHPFSGVPQEGCQNLGRCDIGSPVQAKNTVDITYIARAETHGADVRPLHLATALAVPSVSIFGPTDPDRTVIPGATRVLRKPFACQPCYKRDCPLMHHRCMTEISVEDVFNAAIGLFNASRLLFDCASEGAFFMPNNFTHKQRFGNSHAVDADVLRPPLDREVAG